MTDECRMNDAKVTMNQRLVLMIIKAKVFSVSHCLSASVILSASLILSVCRPLSVYRSVSLSRCLFL